LLKRCQIVVVCLGTKAIATELSQEFQCRDGVDVSQKLPLAITDRSLEFGICLEYPSSRDAFERSVVAWMSA
jgi:hypothetical protein